MKKSISLLLISLALSCGKAKENEQIVEASCGQCQFELKSQNGCDLAVRIDGTAYFVEGAKIDDFGDAHDENIGFCNVIRKAKVTGKVENGVFKATSFSIAE